MVKEVAPVLVGHARVLVRRVGVAVKAVARGVDTVVSEGQKLALQLLDNAVTWWWTIRKFLLHRGHLVVTSLAVQLLMAQDRVVHWADGAVRLWHREGQGEQAQLAADELGTGFGPGAAERMGEAHHV